MFVFLIGNCNLDPFTRPANIFDIKKLLVKMGKNMQKQAKIIQNGPTGANGGQKVSQRGAKGGPKGGQMGA